MNNQGFWQCAEKSKYCVWFFGGKLCEIAQFCSKQSSTSNLSKHWILFLIPSFIIPPLMVNLLLDFTSAVFHFIAQSTCKTANFYILVILFAKAVQWAKEKCSRQLPKNSFYSTLLNIDLGVQNVVCSFRGYLFIFFILSVSCY